MIEADNGTQSRNYPDFISAYLDATELTPAPPIFRKWAAISAIAGALERRVWISGNAGVLYPNMFLLLVGPPGTGKDQAIKPMKDLWASTGKLRLAPVSMSHKGLLDELADAASQRSSIIDGAWFNFHSMLVATPELGVIIPEHNLGYLSLLNELFQCYDLFEEKIRGREGILRIERPHLHIIAGTQPKYMEELFPESAFGMGFTARMIMVYWGTPVKRAVFRRDRTATNMLQDLAEDLRQVVELNGEFTVSDDAIAAIEAWHAGESESTQPRHSKLVHYSARRIIHLLKLCMVYSAARGDSLEILACDFDAARATLYEAESFMPEIFKEMKSGGQMPHIEETFTYVMRYYARTKKACPENNLIHFLMSRVPTNQIGFIIDSMVKSGMLECVGTLGNTNTRLFKPLYFVKPEGIE